MCIVVEGLGALEMHYCIIIKKNCFFIVVVVAIIIYFLFYFLLLLLLLRRTLNMTLQVIDSGQWTEDSISRYNVLLTILISGETN